MRVRRPLPNPPLPPGLGRDSCARPARGSAQACSFPFFPAHGNAAARVSFGAFWSLALGEASSFLA